MRFWTLLTIATVTLAAQTAIPTAPFESVELHNGGHVVIRHGAAQRVTVISGDPDAVRITVRGQRLVIENRGSRRHRHHERLEVEVITPELTAAAVSNGGTLETEGAFPAQASISTAVEQGGTVDVRSVPADTVAASVEQGGRIFTHARETLTASVRSGGAITYWGKPRVTRSIRDGGVVVKGEAR